MRELKIKGIYKHFKGDLYLVEDLAQYSENDDKLVIYRALYGDTTLYARPLDMFLKQTDELKELIAKYPDYPIVVIVDSEVVADYDYGWWYAPEIRFGIGEILDCEQDVDDEKTYIDRDELEEDIEEMLSYDNRYEKIIR